MICRKCGIDRPSDKFHKGRRVCIDCVRGSKREAYQRDLDRQRILSRERNCKYRERSYDKFKATQDRWLKSNPERRLLRVVIIRMLVLLG